MGTSTTAGWMEDRRDLSLVSYLCELSDLYGALQTFELLKQSPQWEIEYRGLVDYCLQRINQIRMGSTRSHPFG